MFTQGRIVLLYWLVYALDFFTSAYLVSLGFGFAETNPFQRALLAAPGFIPLLYWVLNQNIWVALGVLGVFSLFFRTKLTVRLHLNFILALFSFVRLYGVATNVAFVLQAVLGFNPVLAGYYLLLCIPVLFSFRNELEFYLAGFLRFLDIDGNPETSSPVDMIFEEGQTSI